MAARPTPHLFRPTVTTTSRSRTTINLSITGHRQRTSAAILRMATLRTAIPVIHDRESPSSSVQGLVRATATDLTVTVLVEVTEVDSDLAARSSTAVVTITIITTNGMRHWLDRLADRLAVVNRTAGDDLGVPKFHRVLARSSPLSYPTFLLWL